MSLVYLLAQAGLVRPFDGAIQIPLEDTITTCIILMATGYLVWVIIDIVESAVDRIYSSEADLENAYNQTLMAWAKALELRNRENRGHSARVSSLTRLFAEYLSLDPDEIRAAWQGALLHDIGKMGISEAILLKAEGLSEEERRLVHTHPGLGSDLIQDIEYLAGARNVVNWHHERYDGTGFPAQLQGDRIPLIVQIFSLADCWDTIRNGRPCREAQSGEEALAFIADQSGKKFNPEVVKQFTDLVDKFKLLDTDL
jgi:HD-GYP domain-containing protein (c-di-GMP phosphodiesterase class II)